MGGFLGHLINSIRCEQAALFNTKQLSDKEEQFLVATSAGGRYNYLPELLQTGQVLA